MCITYERAAVALVQITRESRYVFMECKKSTFHVNHIRAKVIDSFMRYVSHLLTYTDTVYCLKIIKMYFLHMNV